MKKLTRLIMTLSLAGFGLTACKTENEEHHKANLEAEAKVQRAEAERTALAKVPGGTIKEGELEKEKGKLIWSFDITTPGTKDITEVGVDAITGVIVSVDKESPADEAKEKKAEKKGKKEKEEDEEKGEKK
jgi:uncharacterized membrane protein YkoI